MREYLEQIIAGRDLTENQAQDMMRSIMSGEYTSTQIGAISICRFRQGRFADRKAS